MIPLKPLGKTNEQVLKEWISNHHDLVFRTAFYYVKNKSTAEDIAQEVFVKSYEKLDSFRGDATPSTWLYRITINTCKDYLKSWTYRKVLYTSTFFENRSSHSVENQVLEQFQNDELLQTVMALPTKYREVIVLYYFEEMKTSEIATLLQLKESTIRVRIARGIEKLRKSLKGGDHEWITLTKN
ncbi:sigma-70 family RNA polymerase sigma factor [Brevibacillus daliensis]|uniref:sigma-70 family RNA polymerase sigma factor n=1 Tax=Brevibacillus daliensis TaxID=2892995 RepID=UPI0028160B00|nr:sigma-70 family RNA polymerase sigma factor [Brevibacillus daliensis]